MLLHDGETVPDTSSEIPMVEINTTSANPKAAGVLPNLTRRARVNQKVYRGLRRPRSNCPILWAKYNEVHNSGIREKRRRKTTNELVGLFCVPPGTDEAPGV